jgi:hypothetical protein
MLRPAATAARPAFRVSVAASRPQPSLAESLSNGEAGALAGLIGTSKTPATNASGHPCSFDLLSGECGCQAGLKWVVNAGGNAGRPGL